MEGRKRKRWWWVPEGLMAADGAGRVHVHVYVCACACVRVRVCVIERGGRGRDGGF